MTPASVVGVPSWAVQTSPVCRARSTIVTPASEVGVLGGAEQTSPVCRARSTIVTPVRVYLVYQAGKYKLALSVEQGQL